MKKHISTRLIGTRIISFLFILLSVFLLTGCQEAIDEFVANMSADKTQWYVATTGNDKNPCHTPGSPCRNIATALSRATAKDTIHIADGEYYEMLTVNQEITIKGESMDNTIIDAQMDGGSVIRVEDISDTDGVDGVTFYLSNVTLTGGVTDEGGGLYIKGGAFISIDHVKIYQNAGFEAGGGVYINTAQWAQLSEVRIFDNQTGDLGLGGGIYFSFGDSESPVAKTFKLDIFNSVISDNTAFHGGGVYNDATLSIHNSFINDNTADYLGGGIVNTYDASVLQSVVRHNSASDGAGIYNQGHMDLKSRLNIAESTIDLNNASGDGGGIENSSELSTVSSTIENNSAHKGGGVNNQGDMYSINSTFSENNATRGAGIMNGTITSHLTAENITIADNTGVGLMMEAGTMNLTNVLISNNTGGNCSVVNLSAVTMVSSMSSDGTCSGFIVADVALGALANYGGLTRTNALLPGSPARDAGLDYPALQTDQRQFVRPLDGDGDGIAKWDIGAYEAEFGAFPLKELIPTYTPTPKRVGAFIVPDQTSNCRLGPAAVFGIAGFAQGGQQYDITGRNTASDWVRVKLSNGTPCWLRGDMGKITGDIAGVEGVTVLIPTITPTITASPTPVCSAYSADTCPASHCKVVGGGAMPAYCTEP
jgi:hypothetical protein